MSNYEHCFSTDATESLKCAHKTWHLNGRRALFSVTQDSLEHLMKIQEAICVKHEHIHFELLICAGIHLLWRHYLSDSCLKIPAEHDFHTVLSLLGYQMPRKSDILWQAGQYFVSILFYSFIHIEIQNLRLNMHSEKEKPTVYYWGEKRTFSWLQFCPLLHYPSLNINVAVALLQNTSKSCRFSPAVW